MKATVDIDDLVRQPLAINGGPKANPESDLHDHLFHWPIVTDEDVEAVAAVVRAGSFSEIDEAKLFEAEWGQYLGTEYNLSYPNGTMALQAAMYVAGIRRGDEIICPSITYWASILQCFNLGASAVFCDIDPGTLCIDPNDIERHITEKTKAIVVVHYCGHPCDMDAIMDIADRHGLKIIEDVSHAHGTLYKGRKVGTFGYVSGISMMGVKSFAIGEGGMLSTNSREAYELAVSYSHYRRHDELTDPELKRLSGIPLGGVKGRLNQTCAAMGRVQLKYYPDRIIEIQSAINRFWDMLEGTPGLHPHRVDSGTGHTMGGWYNPLGLYVPEELGGLPVAQFIEAVNAEGGRCGRGINFPLHLHPVFNEADVYGDGKPTRLAFSDHDLRQAHGSLPVAEAAGERAFGIPYFKHDDADLIQHYVAAYRKVALQADKLIQAGHM